MSQIEIVVRLFNIFYNKIYKGSNLSIDIDSGKNRAYVNSFIKLLEENYSLEAIGENFLIEYFAFAFHYYATRETQRRISLNWIIGKKMFGKFFNKNKGNTYYVDQWLFDNNINLDDIRGNLHEDSVPDGLDASEEREKLRFHGEARIIHCLHNTTMFNHRSVNCLSCESKVMCKSLLEKLRPNLYIKRGYKEE